jgi:hypothetical protein
MKASHHVTFGVVSVAAKIDDYYGDWLSISQDVQDDEIENPFNPHQEPAASASQSIPPSAPAQ